MRQNLCAIVLAAAALLAAPAAADPLLTVTGQGTAIADEIDAHINGTADSRGATAAEAIAAHRTIVVTIAKALTALGVPERDFVVTGMALNPQYAPGPIVPNQPRAIAGYNCNTTILVTVEDPVKLDDILQALTASGVNQLVRITFVAQNVTAARDAARAAAVKDAFARAQVLARQTGVTLGPVVSVTDDAAAAGLLNYTEQLMSALTSQGANHNVSATVTIGWAIKP